MATRSERLNQLTIGSECTASWGGMIGDDRRRHCESCHRDVHDFSRLTAREIAIRIEASRGRLCARITRIDGRLVVLPDAAPEPLRGLSGDRHAPSLAAALVTAFLGVAGSSAGASGSSTRSPQAQTAQESSTAARESPVEPVLDAQFEEEISVVGELPPAGVTTAGVMVYQHQQLRELYDNASLVAVATVGASRWVASEDGYGEVATDLDLDEVLKGRVGGKFRRAVRSIVYQHYEPVDEAVVESGGVPAVPAPRTGSQVLVFLQRESPARSGAPPVFSSVDSSNGVKELSTHDLAAYHDRLVELRAAQRGQDLAEAEMDPDDLNAWLVGTVEDPRTRSEALYELQEVAEDGKDDPEVALTDGQRLRLLAALLETQRLERVDVEFFDLVRDQWFGSDGAVPADASHASEVADATRSWLLEQFRRDVGDVGQDTEGRVSAWSEAADRLDNELLADVVQVMFDAIEEVEARQPELPYESSFAEVEVAVAQRRAQVEEALTPLRHQLAGALAAAQ